LLLAMCVRIEVYNMLIKGSVMMGERIDHSLVQLTRESLEGP